MRNAPYKAALSFGLAACCALLAGCGTTKWSDSPRTATEQLLISDAVDRAISEIDFSALSNQKVYLDTRFIVTTLDQNYVTSTLRQHMLACGCIIVDKAEDSTYVVEVRTGSLGTNRQDLLFGIPSTTLPTAGMLPVGSATIPEIALMKRTNQQGVCKIACFAYDRMTGRPVWQSGNRRVASRAKDIWVAGAGPFQSGSIYDGTAFAGERLDVPLVKDDQDETSDDNPANLPVGKEKVFAIRKDPPDPSPDGVKNAGYDAPPSAAPAPANNTAPAAGNGTSPASDAAKTPKAAYTPPPPAAVPPPPPPPPPAGPQGNLPAQPVLTPTGNPAQAAAGAMQTYSWAKDLVGKPKE